MIFWRHGGGLRPSRWLPLLALAAVLVTDIFTSTTCTLPSLLHLQLLALAAAVTDTNGPRRHGPQTQRTFFGNVRSVRELPYGTPSSRCIEAAVVVVVVAVVEVVIKAKGFAIVVVAAAAVVW